MHSVQPTEQQQCDAVLECLADDRPFTYRWRERSGYGTDYILYGIMGGMEFSTSGPELGQLCEDFEREMSHIATSCTCLGRFEWRNGKRVPVD